MSLAVLLYILNPYYIVIQHNFIISFGLVTVVNLSAQ